MVIMQTIATKQILMKIDLINFHNKKCFDTYMIRKYSSSIVIPYVIIYILFKYFFHFISQEKRITV